MAKVIRLTESDLTRIVKKVMNENKNNTRYYSNRNLRRLGRTPVVMVESIDVYRPILMTEGILENFKEKLSSLFDKSKEFLREKAEDIKESIEDSFDKPLDEITLNDIKDKLKELTGIDSEEDEEEEVMAERYYRKNNFLFEDDKRSFADKYDNADLGNEYFGEPVKDKSRIGQRVLNALTTIFGVNLLSFGTIGSFVASFFMTVPFGFVTSMFISMGAITVLMIIRKIMAVLSGHVKESYYRRYRRY